MPLPLAQFVPHLNAVTHTPRILLVDDEESIRSSLRAVLEHHEFQVDTAAGVNDALQLIGSKAFDVLLCDLHMPALGDGLTVVSAMRHANPKAVTIILSGYPAMKEAAAALLLQADEVLVKPLHPRILVKTIHDRLSEGATPRHLVESVAEILKQETQSTIDDWLARVKLEPRLTAIHMDDAHRSAHLPELFADMVTRLEKPLPLGSHALASPAAAEHGRSRRDQGYTAAMMVEESRMLQVSIFQTLQNNLQRVDFSILLVSVMAIADEVDSQLSEAMAAYILESKTDSKPVTA